MWESNTKVDYIEPDQINKRYAKLVEDYEELLTKMSSISKLLEQILNILLSYNPKLAEQTIEELEKINEKTDDKGDEPSGDSPGQ